MELSILMRRPFLTRFQPALLSPAFAAWEAAAGPSGAGAVGGALVAPG
ncbi:MAG: hypothetical protein ACYCZN_16100 [Candidatus Dormibacteria bacterium]